MPLLAAGGQHGDQEKARADETGMVGGAQALRPFATDPPPGSDHFHDFGGQALAPIVAVAATWRARSRSSSRASRKQVCKHAH